ncbi:MAG TPA: nuclear transport factor 2 family protein [Terriglobales bacterium]|nr:nuclear transport factor 2 family protein [Terriglobales bacterium]
MTSDSGTLSFWPHDDRVRRPTHPEYNDGDFGVHFVVGQAEVAIELAIDRVCVKVSWLSFNPSSSREETMKLSRRCVAAGGVAFATAGLLSHDAGADGDEAAVNQAIEDLRKAMIDADKARLEELVAEQLSYGHSGGVIETKEQFIAVIAGKKTVYKSIALSEPSVAVVGNNAIARHIFSAETESDGKAASARVGVLQVWQKQDGRWTLLARQAFRLPA